MRDLKVAERNQAFQMLKGNRTMYPRLSSNIFDTARFAICKEPEQYVAPCEVTQRAKRALHVRPHKSSIERLTGLSGRQLEISRRLVDNWCRRNGGGGEYMTASFWSRALRVVPVVIACFGVLPLPPLPVSLPAVNAPTHLSNTSSVVPSLPSPTAPSVIDTPPALPSTSSQGAAGGVSKSAPATSKTNSPPSAPGGGPQHGIAIPLTTIYISSPLDIALIGALVSLPLLFVMWLFLFGRTLSEARRARGAQIRLLLAADLGLHPRDLTATSTKVLFSLREKAAFDELTGVLRRAAGIGAAEREIARARRHNAPLTVAFVDVDGLKEANDRSGHAAGDGMLRGLAQALRDGLRGEDVVFRYGGDEFVCILPDTTAKDARAKLGAIQLEASKAGIRFSAGLAQLQRSDDVVSLFARADRDLYQFKANRGQIVQLPPPSQKKRPDRTVTA